MPCPHCGFANADVMNFCGRCGAKLPQGCSACGFMNPSDHTFCGKCGVRLRDTPSASEPTQEVPQHTIPADQTPLGQLLAAGSSGLDAERRQLTVLFCDLVDSTALASQLDPEDLREVIRSYQAACAEVVQRFDGHIAQYLGDGLLVYFGYPHAHEDDVQRAVRAGLEIVNAMQHCNAQRRPRMRALQDAPLRVRLGIHTGLVVVGDIGAGRRQEQLALGETPNVAARLQSLAAPDTVMISASTARLVEGYFIMQALGAQELKGLAQPLMVYHVLRESAAQGRLDAVAPRGLTPLVGRELEVGLLCERWTQVQDGHGQVVVLSGEAGIGKSRLIQVLRDQIASSLATHIECRCSPHYQHSALYPVITHLERALAFTREDALEDKLRKLEGALTPYISLLPEMVPLFAALLSLSLPVQYPPLNLTPQRQRQKTLEALLTWLLQETVKHPVLFVMEDLHWMDPSTLDFLRLLVDQGPTARILVLLTCRPEFTVPWVSRTHLTQITLTRLPKQQVERMVASVAGKKALPLEVAQQVAAKTDGVPLFVEELTKTVLESGLLQEREDRYEMTGPLPPLAIPATLHDSLMARLDRLATVKATAQLGATLGRAFPYELLRAVSPLPEETLQQALVRLVEAELLYQRGVPPQTTYVFKHALIQDAAYQSLLKSTRQQVHQRIAQVLETRFPETRDTQPELLAHHYTEAGLSKQSLPYWQKAGQRALQRSANVEVMAHVAKGLEVLQMLPDTRERAQQELVLQTTLGPALMASKGVAAPEVERAYARARALCQQMGDTPEIFPVLAGLQRFYFGAGRLQTARELGEQLLLQAQRQSDPALLLSAHWGLGQPLVWLGEVVAAHEHFEHSIALHDPEQHRSLAVHFGFDPGASCRAYAAFPLWALGYPDRALQRSQEAIALAHKLSHLLSLGFVLALGAMVYQLRREVHVTLERAEAIIALSTDQGFPVWLAAGTFSKGWALAAQGQSAEGIMQMREGLAAWRSTGMGVVMPLWLVLLAEAYGRVGKVEEGLTVLAEALDVVDKNGERFYEAELYRLKGELLLALSPDHHVEAEACCREALAVARHQQAKSLELRAAMSLARLWQQQGKRVEARELLAPIYSWFTEGFGTVDLQEAKALLEELG